MSKIMLEAEVKITKKKIQKGLVISFEVVHWICGRIMYYGSEYNLNACCLLQQAVLFHSFGAKMSVHLTPESLARAGLWTERRVSYAFPITTYLEAIV